MAHRIGKRRGGGRGSYPTKQNKHARSRKAMKNTKIISAMRGSK